MPARRARVLDTVRRLQFASVADLSAAFGVSDVTIRNDLDVLAGEGMVRRVRGGAVHRPGPHLEEPFEEERERQVAARESIARAAAALVENGQTVLLDAGATATATARAIAAREDLHDVTVFTNGVPVALALESAIPRITVMLTGGTLRRLQHSLVDPFGTTILNQVHGHIVMLECGGVDVSAGVTHINVAEVEVKRLMMRAGRRRIVLADSSKIGQVSLVHLFPLEEIDSLITDQGADLESLEALREQGLHITIAD